MTESNRAVLETRERVLQLLSSDEIGKVSTIEVASSLAEGEEFLDLGHLDRGVQRAGTGPVVAMGQVLPRKGVSGATWGRILTELGSRTTAP